MLAAVISINTMHRMLISVLLRSSWPDGRLERLPSLRTPRPTIEQQLIPACTGKNLAELMTRRNRHLMGQLGAESESRACKATVPHKRWRGRAPSCADWATPLFAGRVG